MQICIYSSKRLWNKYCHHKRFLFKSEILRYLYGIKVEITHANLVF